MSINNVSLRSQLRTNIPDDTRIVGRVSAISSATPQTAGKGYTFVYSAAAGVGGIVGVYYILFGAVTSVTCDGTTGALLTASNTSAVKRVLSWNLEPQIATPETAANVRAFYALPVVAPGGSLTSPPIGLQIKSVIPGGALSNPVGIFDGFAFEIYVANTEITV
jgi:hypothetical protein